MTTFAKKMKLSNGLAVISERMPGIGVVSLNIGVRVGSVDETDAESGICHLIEHMVFKGTPSFGPGEIAHAVEAGGGELNAYTSLDQTVYYVNMPSTRLADGLKILKEMVFDALFDAEELEREKEVVVEEIRRGKDSPQRVLGELLFSTFFTAHPYRRPVIGTEAHVRGFSRDTVANFYKRHYRPQNMILGVCGDFDEAELSAVIEKYFRGTASPVEQVAIPAVDPIAEKYKIAMQSMDVSTTYFDVAFRAPALAHPDVAALDVLSHLLGEGAASLLEQETKEREQLVHEIYTSCYTPRYPGAFVIGGQVDGKKFNLALASVRRQIERIRSEPADPSALERAKLLAKSQLIYDKETCEGTARKWMTYETTVGDYNYDAKYIEAVMRLTTEDVRRAAETWLDPSNATLVVVHPPKDKPKVDAKFFTKFGEHTATSKKVKTLKREQGVAKVTLSNGLRVLLLENKRLPVVSLKLVGHGGLRLESPKQIGISALTSSVLTKGTESLSQLQLAERCESLAASLSGYAGRNSWGMSCGFLSDRMRPSVELFADVLLHPAFASDEVTKERAQQLEAIKNSEDNPSQLAFRAVMEKLFDGHPFRFPVSGLLKTVKGLTPEVLRKHYQSRRVAKAMTLAAVGDFDSARLIDVLEESLVDLPSGQAQKTKIKEPKNLRKTENVFQRKQKNQTHLVIGFRGATINDKDRYALEILNNALSGQSGRLFLELRDKQSLAYTVASTAFEGLEAGFFGAYIGTEPSKLQVAIDGLYRELTKVTRELLPQAELDRAKNYIVGNYHIDRQRNGAVAMQLALNELYGKGIAESFDFPKKIESVTAEQVRKAAARVIDFNKCVISVVGPDGKFTSPW